MIHSKGLQTRILTEPTDNLFELDYLKNHLRVDHTQDDILITQLAKSIIAKCEHYAGRAFQQKQIRAQWSEFGNVAVLPFPPHISIDSVQRRRADVGGIQQWGDVTYTYSGLDEWKIYIDATFSTVSWQSSETRVDFTCGYDETPSAVYDAVKDTITFVYENRGEIESDGGNVLRDFNLTGVTKSLLEPYKVYR